MKNNFANFVKKEAPKVQEQIEQSLAQFQTEAVKSNQILLPLIKLLTESIGGGKMIRGMLVKIGYQINSHQTNNDIDKIAAAFEILHTALLIHDDIIDQSTLRRGEKTVYQKLGGKHYGISQAICLGDIGFFLATKIISETTFPPHLKTKILSLFSQMVLDTILGEMQDIAFAQSKNLRSEEEILHMQKLKTAYYTIVWPLSIGATLGGVKKKSITAIKHFGETLGIAFQIQDDILGIFGNEATIGKSVTSDIAEGKNTLLITHAQNNASPLQKKMLRKYYGKRTINEHESKIIKEIFLQTKSLTYAEKKAKSYITEGKKYIPLITKDQTIQSYLHEFADFITARKK